MEFSDLALRLGLALAIGFLIGLERGWRERDELEGQRVAGIRTFSLIGLLGGVIGALSQNGDRVLLAAGLVTLGATLGTYMWRDGRRQRDYSATGLVAAILTFALGAFALLGDIRAAAAAGVAAVILLAGKEALHGWLEKLSWVELRSALQLAAMTFIALPLLPRAPLDPWSALNPYELWLMTILIATVSAAGYLAAKIAGARRGLILAATIGGLFASTAVTLTLARLAKAHGAEAKFLSGGVLASGAVMLLRVLVVAGLINPALATSLAPAMLVAAAAMAIIAFIYVRTGASAGSDGAEALLFKNPFDLAEVFRFGALLAAVMLASAIAQQYYGNAGLLSLAAISGLADVDAMTLSVARMKDGSPLMAYAVLVTVAVNSAAKCVYAAVAGGIRIGLFTLAGSAIAAAAGFLALNG